MNDNSLCMVSPSYSNGLKRKRTENVESDDVKFGIKSGSESSDDDNESELDSSFNENKAFVKLSGFSFSELRAIKLYIEDGILKKIKNMDSIQMPDSNEKSVLYFKNYCVDKIGNMVTLGETGIAEGWNIPKYENEFQSLLGLPFTEDHALSDRLRLKRPRPECFNCMSINHSLRDCPVKIDDERISMHRNIFNSQAQHAQDQANLLSNRYTSDIDAKSNRGFVPGQISNELREALGLRPNQLPPYIYIMRQYGYPIGWFLEARVKQAKLTVHDGNNDGKVTKNGTKKENSIEEGAINSDEEMNNDAKIKEEEVIVYDEDKIYTYEGFNTKPSDQYLDESEKYRVRRYCADFSKEKFLSGLTLENKKKIVKRRSTHKTAEDSNDEEEIEEIEADNAKTRPDDTIENIGDDEEVGDKNVEEFASPQNLKSIHGTSFIEIPGTPIVNNVSEITRVPDSEKFSESICAHKAFEMDAQTPTGSYKNIVKLTRQYKSTNSTL